MRSALLALTLATTTALVGCAADAPTDDDVDSDSAEAISKGKIDERTVTKIIAALDAQRAATPIGRYYEDGARVEGCWLNPAGAKLTPLKKAFYCAMPLEFRLCNTVVLLTHDESQVDARYRGYLDCQRKVDAVFGGRGKFVYGAETNALYRALYLEGASPPAADAARIVAAHQPRASGRSFAPVLLDIERSLAREAADLSLDGLRAMVDDFRRAGGEAR